jgi:hypothetical protein
MSCPGARDADAAAEQKLRMASTVNLDMSCDWNGVKD